MDPEGDRRFQVHARFILPVDKVLSQKESVTAEMIM
jgi:hypothetical protein